MLGIVEAGRASVHAALPVAAQEPGVDQHVLSRYSLTGILPQQTLDQTFSSRTEIVGKVELASPDLCKQAAVLGAVERISATRKVLKMFHNFIWIFLTHLPTNMV